MRKESIMAEGRERDLVLAPNEYAFILDETKGNVIAYVGPHKTSMANTDRPVIFDEKNRRFKKANLDEAIKQFPFAEESWYIVLENPAKAEEEEKHPRSGPNSLPRLVSGCKINIPGPATFPLWPGQVAHVIQGHHLRSNEYLIVRVYNEEAARENWAKAVIKPKKSGSTGEEESSTDIVVKADEEIPDLTTGKMLVVKGTAVSFYIPPTGIEVIKSEEGSYVRKAVTLERLEYCILLDEDGNKRFIQGPDVVFPKPTEKFVEKDGICKFRAIELNEISGIYVKVITAYADENKKKYKEGEELFITGKDQMIYFPRPEHAIIKYGDKEIHYAVAIPAGEARYVLNRLTGEISLKTGPCMFLPDPRKEVIVRRILPSDSVRLWFPGNEEAISYNQMLMEMSPGGFVSDRQAKQELKDKEIPTKQNRSDKKSKKNSDAEWRKMEDFSREQSYTPPRTLTLNTRYEGAVGIKVWTGYAVLVVSNTGQRKVIVGPKTYLLEYDEFLEAMELSTGTPKTDKMLMKTVYLRVLNNKVSDVVTAETHDLCQVHIHLSYRVNFEGDSKKWFNVENYVRFLTDHMRSVIRNVVKSHGVEDFYSDTTNIIRNTVLGSTGEGGKRPGRVFEENGMRIYDVEILDVQIGDKDISKLLVEAQHSVVRQTIKITQERKNLEVTKKSEKIKQQIAQAQAETTQIQFEIKLQELQKELEVVLSGISSDTQAEEKRLSAQILQQEKVNQIHHFELERKKAQQTMKLEFDRQELQQKIEAIRAEVAAVVEKAQAVSPGLISALQAFADKNLAEKMAETMAPLAIIGGNSISDVFSRLLKGTVLENILKKKPTEKQHR